MRFDFQADADKIAPLMARFKLNEDILRVQTVAVQAQKRSAEAAALPAGAAPEPASAPAAGAEGSPNAVA